MENYAASKEMLENLPNNSNRARSNSDDKKEINKVVTGNVTVKKKSGTRKFFGSLVNEDASTVKNYILGDIILPAIKDIIYDTITNSVSMSLYGETKGASGRRGGGSGTSKINYNSITKPTKASRTISSREGIDLDDLVLERRGEADEVIDNMVDLIDRYGSATVADLYETLGLDYDRICNNYGWKKLGNAGVRKVRDGWLLDLPKPQYLD